MEGSPRQRMVEGAARLLAERGLQATSFSEVLAATGAPRGSVYHHFPGGKAQLVAEALAFAGHGVRDRLESLRGRPANQVAAGFFGMWRQLLVAGGFRIGCSAAAVTAGAESAEQLDSAADVFRSWTEHLAELLTAGGVQQEKAPAAATALISTAEGAVLVSRAAREIEPFDAAAAAMEAYVRGLVPSA